jgi:hypothetical protein
METRLSTFNLTKEELALLRPLATPQKIQDFLNTLPINWEKEGETYYSPRLVLRHRKAHCIEGALLAAAALWLCGEEPLVMDLKATDEDDDHVVALFRHKELWGAISKTNHATVRYRDPVYRSPRELAMSYFHEYFVNTTGRKVLRSYSRPLNLRRFGDGWITAEHKLDQIAEAIDWSPHYPMVPGAYVRHLRPADPVERRAGEIIEWHKDDPRT